MRALAAVVVLAALGTCLYAQTPEMPSAQVPEMTCPLCGHHFVPSLGEMSERSPGGGVDSDGCRHFLHGPRYGEAVIVCPRCNYAAVPSDFPAEIKEDKKAALLRALAHSSYRGVTDVSTEIPPWERFRLEFECDSILGRDRQELAHTLWAVWSVRIEECRVATGAASLMFPGIMALAGQGGGTPIESVIKDFNDRIGRAAKAEERGPASAAACRDVSAGRIRA